MTHLDIIRSAMYAAFITLLTAVVSDARIVPPRSPRDGVLDSSLIVIVRKSDGDTFRIEDVFLGEKKVGDTINLPGFRLYTIQMYGPEQVEAFTPETRVLLFLKPREKAPESFEITYYGYCFFWVHDAAKVKNLQRMAEDALKLRRGWEQARDIGDERKRVEALWPYLWRENVSFIQHTQTELQQTGTIAGDYIAEMFADMKSHERMTLLPDLGDYGGGRLHSVLIEHLKDQQRDVQNYVENQGTDTKGTIENWDTLPKQVRKIWGELYYGLAGLASFHDRNDLPFIRELALWAVDHRFKQTCDAALVAFRDMPDKQNLPVIAAIWQEFSARPYQGNALSPSDVTRSLRTHKYPETVPVLVQLLNNETAGNEAKAFLTEIVGEDLGDNPATWLKWYEAQNSIDKK
ncbi:MAG: hypothetical protein WEB58_01740 [Planctomycetaceae bacterium]